MKVKIDPKKQYAIKEIIEDKLIPGVESHTVMYNLITCCKESVEGEKKGKWVRTPYEKTTKRTIKPILIKNPWNTIVLKYVIEGKELIEFFKLNNII